MTSKELMRRKPGQKGCCGCGLAAMLGVAGLVLTGVFTLARQLGRRRSA